jgi:hypothetical protein
MGFRSLNPSFIASQFDVERPMRRSLVIALTLLAAPLAAQQAAQTVSPGMTKAQVVVALGQPATARTVSDYTYLFYTNSCGKRCGMNDLVVLHGDSVVDAIFRSPSRHYSGTSSSPTPVPPEVAARKKPAAAGQPMKTPASGPAKSAKAPAKPAVAPAKSAAATAKPAAKPTQMKPGPPNDTRPSIPVKPPAVKPATTTKPDTKTP